MTWSRGAYFICAYIRKDQIHDDKPIQDAL